VNEIIDVKVAVFVPYNNFTEYIMNKLYVFFYNEHEIFYYDICEDFDETSLTKVNL